MRYYLDSKLRLIHKEVKRVENKDPTDNNVHYVAGILAAIKILELGHKNSCSCDPFPCETVEHRVKN